MDIDPPASGLFVPYAELSPTAIAETKQRISDTILATLGGAASVSAAAVHALLGDDPPRGDHAPLHPVTFTTTRQMTTFVNAWMLRQADWMDSYRLDGRKQAGHPSDQFAAIFALCDHPRMTGERLMETVHLAYQLWRAWTEAMPDTTADGWDNTTKLSLCVPVLAATVDGASVDRLNDAVRLSASSGAVLAQVRRGTVTNWKSGNSGYVSANSLWAYDLSATFHGSEGMLGETDGGWSTKVTPIRCEPHGVSPDEIYRHMEMKAFPCFQFGQAPVACATRLHGDVAKSIDDVELIEIALPPRDHQSATRRNWQKPPENHSEADHNIAYCVATALREGTLGPRHYDHDRLEDPTTRRLMSVMSVIEMPAEGGTDLACSIRVRTGAGVESEAAIRWDELGVGHLDGPERVRRRDELIATKRRAVEEAVGADLHRVLELVDGLEGHDGSQLLRAVADAVPTLATR